MNKCEALNCNYYLHETCDDPQDFVNKNTGVPCCRYDSGAMPILGESNTKEQA